MKKLPDARWAALDPALRALLVTDVLTLLAQMVGYLAIPWWIVQRGGAHDLASYGIAIAIATFVSFPLLAPIAERLSKQRQMLFGTAALAGAALCFALFASVGRYELAAMVGIGLASVVANAFVASASSSITAELLSAEVLPAALRARKTAASIGRLIGPALGGAVLAGAGIASVLWLHFGLLALASIAVRRIPVPPLVGLVRDRHRKRRGKELREGFVRWRDDLRAGLVAKWAVPLERGWTLVNFLVWIFVGPAYALLLPLKVHALGLSGAWFGACEAALSIGMLTGSLGIADRSIARFGRYRVRIGASVGEGLLLALAGLTSTPALMVLAFVAAGCANTAMALVGATHRALAIPREYRVRINAVNVMSTQVANALGPALAGVALLHASIDIVYPAFGLAAALLAACFTQVPRAREFFELEHHAVRDWYRLQYPHGFAATDARPLKP